MKQPKIRTSLLDYQLIFRRPFRIAHGSRTFTEAVFIKLSYKGFDGFGEASLPPYLEENQTSVHEFFRKVSIVHEPNLANLSQIEKQIDQLSKKDFAAKAAYSVALYDLISKLEEKPLYQLLGIELPQEMRSSYTLSMGSEEELREEMQKGIPADFIKVKLGGSDDMRQIKGIRKYCDKPGWVDPNQGWSDRGFAYEMACMLKEEGFLFIEQPFSIEKQKDTEWLRGKGVLPIIADESCQTIADLDRVQDAFDGINIKLMKCGGIAGALQLFEAGRNLNMKILLGGMAESSCAAAAAANLAGLADHLDLDGPLLIGNDPFTGYHWEDGRIVLSGKPGHGAIYSTSDRFEELN